MSAAAAAATVRDLLAHVTGRGPVRTTITGITTPLGQTITATVVDDTTESPGHLEARLVLADMNRGDNDSDLGVVIDPSGALGIDRDDPEAWNVHMTLPTLLRILGAAPTPEKE